MSGIWPDDIDPEKYKEELRKSQENADSVDDTENDRFNVDDATAKEQDAEALPKPKDKAKTTYSAGDFNIDIDEVSAIKKSSDAEYSKLAGAAGLGIKPDEGVSIQTIEEQLEDIKAAEANIIETLPEEGAKETKLYKPAPSMMGKTGGRLATRQAPKQTLDYLDNLAKERKKLESFLSEMYDFENIRQAQMANYTGEAITVGPIRPGIETRIKAEGIVPAESFKELKEQEIKGTAKIETVDISENERAISDFNKDLTAQETKRVGRKKSTPPQVEQTAEELKRELKFGIDTAGTLDPAKSATPTTEAAENTPPNVFKKQSRERFPVTDLVSDIGVAPDAGGYSFGQYRGEGELQEVAAEMAREKNITNPPVDLQFDKRFATTVMRSAEGKIVPYKAEKIYDEEGKFTVNKKLRYDEIRPSEKKKYQITAGEQRRINKVTKFTGPLEKGPVFSKKGLKRETLKEATVLIDDPSSPAIANVAKQDLPEFAGPLKQSDLVSEMKAQEESKFIGPLEKGTVFSKKGLKQREIVKGKILDVKERTGVIKLKPSREGGYLRTVKPSTPGQEYKPGYQDLLLAGHELPAKAVGDPVGGSKAIPAVSEGKFKTYLATRNITGQETGGQSIYRMIDKLSKDSAESLYGSHKQAGSLGSYGIKKADVFKVLQEEAMEIEKIRKDVESQYAPGVKSLDNPVPMKNPYHEDAAKLDVSSSKAKKEFQFKFGERTASGKLAGTYNVKTGQTELTKVIKGDPQYGDDYVKVPNIGQVEHEFREAKGINTGPLADYGTTHPKVLKELAPKDKKYLFESEAERTKSGTGLKKQLGVPDTGGFQHLFKQSEFSAKVKEFEKALAWKAYVGGLKGQAPRLSITSDTDVILKNTSPESFARTMQFATKGMQGENISKNFTFNVGGSEKINPKSLRQVAAAQFTHAYEGSKEFGKVEKGVKFVDELKKAFKLIGKKG